MFISIALILLFCECFLCECNFNDETASLACKNEAFNDIVRNYSTIKSKITIAIIRNCNLNQLKARGIPFRNLKELHITCNIEELKMESLYNLVGLRTLDLSNNKISQIPNNFYSEFKNLTKLNLSKNRLRNPTIDSLYYLTELHELNLSFNRITNIDLGVLDNLPKLKILKLNNNGIYVLHLGVFDETHNLQDINLAHNSIPDLSLGIFDQNPLLKNLNLSYNLINDIALGIFDKSPELVEVDLSYNKIKKINTYLFDETVKLTLINIGGNNGNTTQLNFDMLKSIEILKLSGAKLNLSIDSVFYENQNLKELDLSLNSLASISEGLFKKTHILEFLNISHNALSDLPLKLFQQTNLKVIDISYNHLEEIKPNLLNMETLERLYVRNNRIYHLNSLAFTNVGNTLKYLDMRNNRLVFIEAAFFERTTNLEIFEITGNPWDCKCFDDLLKMLHKRFIEYSKEDYFQGTKSSCIAFNPFDCTVEMKDIKKYYEEYYKLISES